MQNSAFRAYDIRGIVGKNSNLENVFTLGKA
jgi:phosphomannomutase